MLENLLMKRIWMVISGIGVIAIGIGALLLITRPSGGTQASFTPPDISRTVKVTRGSLSETIGASGTALAGQSADMLWETSGRVDEILVSMGQVVQEGQVLAELNQETLPDDHIYAEADLIAAQQELEELLNSETPASQAYDTLLEAQEAYEDAQYRFDSINAVRTDADTLELAEIDYQRAQANVDRMENVYSNLSYLNEGDSSRAAALTNLNRAIQSRDNALATVNWYKGAPTDAEYSEKQAALMSAKAALEDAQREYDRLIDGPDADDIQAAQARVNSIQSVIDQYKLEAPFDATITNILIDEGSLVSAGSSAFRLDDLSRLYIELQVSEVDINAIQTGQACRITFDALGDEEYQGQVYEVDQVGTTSSGVVYFTVTVQVTGAGEEVKPGMTALVDITIDTHENVLTVPTRAITTTGDSRFVTVVNDGETSQVEVTVGITSNSMTEITAGNLQEGDSILIDRQ
jgi:HlyD family secretion protein